MRIRFAVILPKNLKTGSVVKKISAKNRRVGVKLSDTVYILIPRLEIFTLDFFSIFDIFLKDDIP